MIGKVITGKSFGGCIRYVVQKHDAIILDAAGIRIQEASQMINDFNLQRKFNPDLGKAVGHIVLSWSVNDAAKLNDELMVTLAKEYLHKMKIRDTHSLVVKHNRREHPHIHIIYNRVDNNGKTISDNFQKQRNVHVTKELTLKHGFYLSPGKELVKRQALKGADKVKYELFDAIRSAKFKGSEIDRSLSYAKLINAIQ